MIKNANNSVEGINKIKKNIGLIANRFMDIYVWFSVFHEIPVPLITPSKIRFHGKFKNLKIDD